MHPPASSHPKALIQFFSTVATFASVSSFAAPGAIRGAQLPARIVSVRPVLAPRGHSPGRHGFQFLTCKSSMATAEDILCGLDGTPMGYKTFTDALSAVEEANSPNVNAVEIVTENHFPTSHTAVIKVSREGAAAKQIFVKKVSALAMAHKPWTDRRRTLAYARTEMRFYQEFAQELAARGVSIPRCAATIDVVEPLLGDTEVASPAGDEPESELLSKGGGILMLECVEGYTQASPISEEQARVALRALAQLHAAGWEDRALLSKAAARLQRHGGSFSLSIRNPKELTKIHDNWSRFVSTFTPFDPELFGRPEILLLGERLDKWCRWTAEQLSLTPGDKYATLMHGDLKAMNVFLPAAADGSVDSQKPAMLIDFASTGVGLGMHDLAMLLTHSIAPETHASGGEERIIDGYLSSLAEARARLSSGGEVEAYPREEAMRHYRLAVVDYGRFFLSRFWGDASPENFAKKKDEPNVSLANRSVDAALRFVERIDRALAALEAEGLGPT